MKWHGSHDWKYCPTLVVTTRQCQWWTKICTCSKESLVLSLPRLSFSALEQKKKTASPNNDQHCLSHKTHCQNIWKDCGVLHWHNSSQNPISTYKQSVFLPTWPNGPPCGEKWMDKCARCCDNAPLWRVPHGQETRPCQIRQYDSMLHKKLHQWLLAGWQ